MLRVVFHNHVVDTAIIQLAQHMRLSNSIIVAFTDSFVNAVCIFSFMLIL